MKINSAQHNIEQAKSRRRAREVFTHMSIENTNVGERARVFIWPINQSGGKRVSRCVPCACQGAVCMMPCIYFPSKDNTGLI